MKLNRREFLSALKQAMPGIETGISMLDGADTFIFNNGFIYTYNDAISVAVPFSIVDKSGGIVSGALKAQDFYNLINRFTEDEITFIPKETEWIFKTEKAKAVLTMLGSNIGEYISKTLPGKDAKWHELPERFIEGLAVCSFSANRSVLSGIYIKDGWMISTDEMRINQYDIGKPVSGGPVWISDSAIKELTKLTNIKKYHISETWIHFISENGTIFSCKKLDHSKYPIDNIESIIQKHQRSKSDISNELPNDILAALNRAAVLSQNVDSFDTVQLTFMTNEILVYSQRPSGKYTETVPLAIPFKKEIKPAKITIDYAMIENGLKYGKEFYLKEISQNETTTTNVILASKHGSQIITTFASEESE